MRCSFFTLLRGGNPRILSQLFSSIQPLGSDRAVMERHKPYIIVSLTILTVQLTVLMLLAVQAFARTG